MSTSTSDFQESVVVVAGERLVASVDEFIVVFLLEVVLVGERSEVTGNHCVSEFNPLSLVATVDVVVLRDTGTIVGLVFLFQTFNSLLSPNTHLVVDSILIVVFVREQTRHESLFHRSFTVHLGEEVPRVSLDSVTDTGEGPVFSSFALIDHVFKVHTLIPVHHTPCFTTGIACLAVVVVGKTGVR